MIQIDMEMPKSCYQCKFLVQFRTGSVGSFGITVCTARSKNDGALIEEKTENTRATWCSLKEVKET